ncbi:4-alpha-glucanotransferase [Leptolyngbya sp. FACHB-261]|uniref:4-alpha-glucanotransferase n=1 Tax=Leptolyngbya sp. FACHB-261 TaxID=2692806 RepID=UPI0016822443|nr:4-alpha-glucanotransferase [Leptolyngbya sp. FACHB-261]MBD2099280.1 4-alpha-glucanotransferase [Leptolyngbya sp. FACHB-261]
MPFPRSSGILLHPTCLPGRYGIGDLGLEAYQFVDFLARSAQQLWQVLPLGPTGFGNSPYMCFSAIAGNPLLISPEVLRDNGFLGEDDLRNVPDFPLDQVDFERVVAWKLPLLRKASQNFAQHATAIQQMEFDGFCRGKASWLDDYTLFMALLNTREEATWNQWPHELRHRKPEALEAARQQLADEIFFHKYMQFEFFRQWSELKRYANDQNIQIIGDIPIYVAHNSVDVWAHPEIFQLNPETGEPQEMAGVPPDYFSADGQLWGNPVYNWPYLESTRFSWWIERIRALLTYVDLIRIDHFRGLEAYWSVPAGEETAMNGRWIKAPGYALFETIREELGSLPILAEDLGDISPEVLQLRDHFEFPGMRILQFAFGNDAKNPFLPFNFSANSVVYTGTHDNNTTVGWYNQISDYERGRLHEYLGCTGSYGIAWDMIRLALSSVANQALIPLQDIFSLGSNARMNFPSSAEGNWAWRYRSEALTEDYSNRLKAMVKIYGRYAEFPGARLE